MGTHSEVGSEEVEKGVAMAVAAKGVVAAVEVAAD